MACPGLAALGQMGTILVSKCVLWCGRQTEQQTGGRNGSCPLKRGERGGAKQVAAWAAAGARFWVRDSGAAWSLLMSVVPDAPEG